MSTEERFRTLRTIWRRFRHRLYRDRPGWRRSPWAGGSRYWHEPDDGWPG
jgi:hypothetical protein